MKLTALRANNPVAVMAAYGALRILPGARLRWAERSPELDWDGDVIAELARQLPQRRQSPEVTALDDPRDKNVGGTAGFYELAKSIPGDWLVAYASEAPEGIRGSGLLLVGGGHKFVTNARAVMDDLVQLDVGEKLKEALIGPWRYADHGPLGAGMRLRGLMRQPRLSPLRTRLKLASWELTG